LNSVTDFKHSFQGPLAALGSLSLQ